MNLQGIEMGLQPGSRDKTRGVHFYKSPFLEEFADSLEDQGAPLEISFFPFFRQGSSSVRPNRLLKRIKRVKSPSAVYFFSMKAWVPSNSPFAMASQTSEGV